MAQSYRVAAVDDVPEGEGREVMAGGQIVALFRVNGELFAMDGMCPHAGGPLAQGEVRGNVVTCPWHGWQFDVTTGKHCLNPRVQHRCFPVKVEAGEVFVEV